MAPNAGVSMGDKNVIAGDVIGKKVTFENGATFIHNEDETRKLVQCHVCNRNMAISESIECPRCGETVCESCYDRSLLLCSNCRENDYNAIVRKVADGGIVSLTQGNEKTRNLLVKALKEKLGIRIQGTILQEYQASEQTKHFIIPSGITTIACRAFCGSGIVAVEIPSTVTTIHECAFLKCPNLQKVVLNEGVESIGEHAFDKCEKLSEITIPGSVKKIEKSAFIKCSNLQKVVLNDGLESIGEYAFQGCANLSEVDVPGSVKRIEKYAFSQCPDLQKVVLNEGLKLIGENAFWQCSNLSEITIPGSVKKIEDYAFKECPSLSSLRVPSSTLLGNGVFAGEIIRV